MKTLTLDQFKQQLKDQGVELLDFAFSCPMCGTIQSARLLIKSGAGEDYDAVSRVLGFSCVGRFTGKGSPSKESAEQQGCNWSLGGLFQTHTLEVITPDGEKHPHFEPATAEQAQSLANRLEVSGE